MLINHSAIVSFGHLPSSPTSSLVCFGAALWQDIRTCKQDYHNDDCRDYGEMLFKYDHDSYDNYSMNIATVPLVMNKMATIIMYHIYNADRDADDSGWPCMITILQSAG